MTVVELAELVRRMRLAQKDYFRSRTSTALETSKALEKRLDAVVKEILTQPTLFDREESPRR